MKADFDIVITSNKSTIHYWKELWRFKELMYFFAWRDVLVRYKQTTIGIAWGLVRPLLTLLAFIFVFNKIANIESKLVPYPILILSALIPWQFMSSCISEASGSLISNSGMISKVYFPRLIIPITSIIVNFIDFTISFTLLIILCFYFGVPITFKIIFIPVFLLIGVILSLGISILLSALIIKYRDIKFLIPFILQFGLYISPIGYETSLIPQKWSEIYSLNPVVGIVEGFRWCIYANKFSELNYLIVLKSFVISILLLLVGLKYFRKTESTFADTL